MRRVRYSYFSLVEAKVGLLFLASPPLPAGGFLLYFCALRLGVRCYSWLSPRAGWGFLFILLWVGIELKLFFLASPPLPAGHPVVVTGLCRQKVVTKSQHWKFATIKCYCIVETVLIISTSK